MRIGPRYDKICANVNTYDGRQITLSKMLHYLGIILLLLLHGSLDQALVLSSSECDFR